MTETHHLTVEAPDSRLDRYVCQKLPALSRTHAQKLITEGHIKVNDQPSKSGQKLAIGDRINVYIPPTPPSNLLPEAIPLNIIYEDSELLVIDKPAGMTVHPAPGNPNHTLVNAVLAHVPNLPESGEPLRPGIVHRLDKDTSGLIVVAKNRKAHTELMNQFKSRSVAKTYTVLVKGHLSPERGVIDAPIGRDTRHRKRMAVVDKGREARTNYRVTKYLKEHTLLEVKPETGRTHQIRVHLSAIGHPVAGDETYGTGSPHLSRQFIHASRLGFKLPSTGKDVAFEAPLPPDLEAALKALA